MLAERVALALADALGRERARELVAAARAPRGGLVRDALRADPRSRPHGDEELEQLLDPAAYLGSAEAFVDRALGRARAARSGAA